MAAEQIETFEVLNKYVTRQTGHIVSQMLSSTILSDDYPVILD